MGLVLYTLFSPMSLSPRIPLLIFLATIVVWTWNAPYYLHDHHVVKDTDPSATDVYDKCAAIKSSPGPSPLFLKREVSDRFEAGVNTSWLITNATLVVGRGNDTHWIQGYDLYLDKGIIKAIGSNLAPVQNTLNLTIVNANRRWVTAGLVDIHSYLGVLSAPFLAGSLDFASSKGPTTPWLQIIDGINPHDESFQLAMAGGVTSALVQSGGRNTIGSQAFVVKLRPTMERSPSSMLVEPRFGSGKEENPTFWRHLVQACGETPSEYGTRPDAIWSLRSAYAEARHLMTLQENYCAEAEARPRSESMKAFPEDIRLDILVDVLRGKVKVSSHCQGAVDIDALVRLTNEYKFPVASLQQASEAWLVPSLLNKTWGGMPTVSLFATNYHYDYPSYRGSEFAPRILADAGIPVALKSGHPTVNSRYLAQEAQLAHYYGLPSHLSLAAITSVAAKAVGLEHRIGSLEEGADADVVMWDSNPLQVGATPVRVWIDGQLQIPLPTRGEVPVGVGKDGEKWAQFPSVPDWEKERREALEWEGLPPLAGRRSTARVVFYNVREVRHNDQVHRSEVGFNVVLESGRAVCIGDAISCSVDTFEAEEYIDLNGGVIVPGMMSFGSPLGTEEIHREPSTGAGWILDAFVDRVPPIFNDPGAIAYAMDSLMFGTRNARSGVTSGTVFPISKGGLIAGISSTFAMGSGHAMEKGAIVQKFTALLVSIHRSDPLSSSRLGVNEQIAGLRRLLLGWENQETDTGRWFKKAAEVSLD
ncbi:hypothetical protein C8F01DRAFT_1118223 [Mycena amicta]|nr:hypothetical protein C8F01DRAFT_1118223 [Mycena amicta]